MLETIKARLHSLKADLAALYLAYRDPRTPWYAKGFALLVVAYAVSPLDLIPDPIPILGYLDDIILLPLGIWVAVRLIPRDVLAECRARSRAGETVNILLGRWGVALVIVLWVLLAALTAAAIWRGRLVAPG